MTQKSSPEDGHNMVTGATDQIGNCHDMTGVHEKVTYCPPPLVHPQGSKRKTALPVNRNSSVRTPLQRSKQIKFCWPFSNWQITICLRTFILTSTEFPNCQSHKRQRCPRLTENLRNLNFLKTFSKRVSRFTIS